MLPLRRLPLISQRTIFSFAKKPLWPFSSTAGPLIPQRELVDEEICPDYNSAAFYPAKPGDAPADRFQLLVKIGWGTRSTVWLARDISRFKWQHEQAVALKITNSNTYDEAQQENGIETHIMQQNTEHRGGVIVRKHLDDFEVTGPHGKHLCLVYEPMREPLWIFQRRFKSGNLPLPIAKAYIYCLLDLKLDNILMTFESEEILASFIDRQQQQPMHYKVDDEADRIIYRCHNDFGALDVSQIKNMFPKIADFGLASKLDQLSETLHGMNGESLGIYPIQPDHYRAPEVTLGCGWNSKAEISGTLLWDIIGRKELFQQVLDADGQYDAKSHLAEMISLLGPPPRAFLAKSKTLSKQNWPQPVTNERGKVCNNAEEFFDGPFFDAEDKFLFDELVPSRSFEDTIPFLEENDREAFLSFARQMLAWVPEERKTARELMDHPFLKLGG
ncbi:hypothetical protein ASPBRDRAFT_57439 [Aspergillus brasiliensis CBS 101740]|uniref:non-specific serine/threonine protein kinase n=1 Tax=Aspergillus brasiliensis (strain CBS 101740 / IMI 381727 / IBT 21946) TaxID=767769 RepID=A0A1L9UB57_ASPBC|nr:hypothetical protein ASPBRDRAFT_57439 [Aspergillus brasiliensis CBS 101740]